MFMKSKRTVSLFICTVYIIIAPLIGKALQQPVIKPFSLPLKLTCDNSSENIKGLSDGQTSTVWTLKKDSVLKINCETEIGSIYIIWNKEPVPWTLNHSIPPDSAATTSTTTTTTLASATNTSVDQTGTTTERTSDTTGSQTTQPQTGQTENTTEPRDTNETQLIPMTKTAANSKFAQQASLVTQGGRGGLLHEFVPVSSPARSFTLQLENKNGEIADIYVFEKDKVPDWVQQWRPMLDKADMLVFSAHADDEHLWFGGTLPVYAGEYQKKVQVAYLIRHGLTRPESYRNHELLDGLWKVGVKNYPMISDFGDYLSTNLKQAMNTNDVDAMQKYTVMLLRRFKPDVVVSHDPNGEYGHGVHRLCAYLMQKAIQLSGNKSSYPDLTTKYGVWNIQKCYLHLYKKNPVVMNWSVPLKAFGGKTGFQMANEGYQCHVSQQSKWFYVAPKESSYDSQKFGLYYTSVGTDAAKNNFFEHIRPVGSNTVPATTTTTATSPASQTTTQTAATESTATLQTRQSVAAQNHTSPKPGTGLFPHRLNRSICVIFAMLNITAFALAAYVFLRVPFYPN